MQDYNLCAHALVCSVRHMVCHRVVRIGRDKVELGK